MATKTIDQFSAAVSPLLLTDIIAGLRTPGAGHITIFITLQQLLDFVNANITSGGSAYANFDALRAETLLFAGRAYVTLGYAAAGDSLGKIWYYDPASVLVDNDASVLMPVNGLGRFRAVT